ncbi:glycosyltransferase family 4 protein [Tsukamurella ocularis]|uniref:glycosyltransferase family 4 protein n=1 Tax=Tsukamurella ocularis TaxID=1970234 RepID=UPI00216A519B|nr:glycosyltransferase family 4 protein [Tsukamurella ocularis]MCS3779659.1 glycosyltransferase involved in cell wall biosynthesis [Tsukamurella ocularis]MCS3788941.1 glycosyltransferase involved in cell wall biosynthesis [Tsukamurella ocularis]MCS3850151.1 glycosyltransferase involved in cell wall biosynthesis [Tsukamurella ocularis]
MTAVPVHLTGTTWPGTAPGGLPRYFADLFAALRRRTDVAATAAAFGDPESGGSTWGPDAGSTAARVRASRRPAPVDTAVLDRHFALFGPAPRGAALVTHFHGPWAQESATAGEGRAAVAVKALVERTRYRDSDHFVVLSQSFADVLVERYGADRGAITVIPPGVDLARFAAAPAPDGPPRVLCVRRLERRMGINVLLRAWPAVTARHPDARLDVVGDGSEHGLLRQRAAELGITDTVTFVGTIDDADLARRYAAATLTAVPSLAWEGFGLVALESLASGRAPVVTDVGGLPDAVRDLAPDLVVPAGDAEALADRLASGLDGLRPSAEACRAHAERFTWDAAAAQHAALYRAVAA